MLPKLLLHNMQASSILICSLTEAKIGFQMESIVYLCNVSLWVDTVMAIENGTFFLKLDFCDFIVIRRLC